MRILTPTIIANNESQPSTAGALLRIHDQDATSGESLLIVSSDDSDYYFKVASNGRVHFRGNATDGDGQIKVHLQHSGFTGAASSLIWDSSGGANQMSIRQSEENSDLFVYAHAQSLNLAEFARTTADVTFNAQVTVNGQGSDILDLYDNAATPVNVFKVQNDGAVHLGAYGSGTFTGTAAYTLAVDSSGNVIEITPTDANTTYDLTSAQSGTDVDITLTGSDATTDTVTLVAGDAITLTDDGSNNVTIATDGTAESTHIAVKNTSGSTITKGTPVYITGNVGSSDRLQIAAADASDSAKMPAVGLLETDLINNAEGYVVQGGYLRNITTATIDGTSTSSNDTVYVKAGGGLTMTKPTGSTNYIQNIAKVARVGTASEGSLIVSSILRTNDIPNLADGQVWVGSTTYPVGTDFNLQEVTDGGNTTTNSIGIGVLSPSAFLEIANPTYSDATVLLGRQAGYPTIQGNGTSGGQWLMLDSNGGYLALNNHVTDNVILAWGGGDVAVGTGSPLARFHVKGSGNTSATTALLVENSSGTDTFKVLNDGQAQLGNYGSGTFTGTVSKVLAVESNGNIIETTLSDLSGVDGSGTANYLPKWSDSDTLTDSVMYDNGTYVGIGTTSPNNELEILGSNSPRISLRTSNEAVSEALELGFQVGTGANASSNSVGLIKSVITQATPSALIGDMEFQTNSGDAISTKMIIKGDGNVGIGTTTPSGRVNIQSAAASTYLLNLDYSDGTDGGGFYEASSTDLSLFLKNSSGTNTVTIATDGDSFLNGGNVGIGTSTPVGKLTVNTGTSTANLNISNQENGSISFHNNATNKGFPTIVGKSNDGAGLNLISATNDTNSNWDMQFNVRENDNSDFTTLTSTAFLFSRSSTKLLTILRNGAVGIGTSSPSYNLDIESSTAQLRIHSTTNNAVLRIESPNTKESKIYFGNDSQVDSGTIEYNHTSKYMSFDTDNSERMRITSTGAVGIGTSTPSANLEVSSVSNTLIRLTSTGDGLGANTNIGSIEYYGNDISAPGAGVKASIRAQTKSTLGDDAELIFSNSDGVVNDIERMRITSNGAVGIGTSNPSEKLEVNGRIKLGSQLNDTVDAAYLIGQAHTSTGNNHPLMLFMSSLATVNAMTIGGGSTVYNCATNINFNTAADTNTHTGTTAMTINSSQNIGIGTSNPSAKLDIEGGIVRIGGNHPTSPFASQLYLDAPVSSDSVLNFHQAGSQVGKLGYDASLSGIAFVSGTGSFATADMVILDGGNVGIGTSTPSAKLHIFDSGTSYTNLTEGITLSNNAGSTNDRLPSITWDYGTAGTPTFAAIETTRASSIGGNLVFHTAQTNGTLTERMRITSTGAVGIGTTSPSGQLHVNTEAAESTKVYIDGEASQEKSIQIRHYDASEGSGVGRNLFYLKTPSAGRLDLGGFTDGSTEFQTMTFLESGAVGIGTSTPGAKLHVQRSDDGGIGIFRGTSNAQLIIGIDSSNLFYDASNGNANHVFKSNDVERMRITSTGAVGIGTSTPSAKLSILGSAQGDEVLRLSTAVDTRGLKVTTFAVGSQGNAGINFDAFHTTDAALRFSTKGTEALYIDGSQNIGIGTSTPIAKLHIFGSFNEQFFTQQSGTTNKFGISSGTAYTGFSVGSSTTQAARFYHDNSYITFAENGANVGINKTSPSAKLHIVGSGNTSSTTALLVESNNGTDRLRVTDGSEVFVNASTLHYGADVASTTLGYKEFLTDVDYGTLNTGAISVYTSESTRDTIMCDYKIYDGTNIRVGTVTATTDGTSVDYTDIRKAEVGDTSDMYFYAQLSGSNLQLIFYRGSAGYDAKYIIKNF
jgi:hypothetical protein